MCRVDRMSLRNRTSWALLAVGPFAILELLLQGILPDPTWTGANFHFLIVSLTSFIALIMAALMVVAAGQLKDARVVFLSLGFLGIAGIFSVHGLTTPGAIVAGATPWVGFSAKLSLLVGAVFLALSTISRGSRVERAIIAHQ